MKLTIKHYYRFEGHDDITDIDVDSPDAWDKLRLEGGDTSQFYAMPKERNEWIEKCDNDQSAQRRARDIGNLTRDRFHRVNSYGVGNGCLEYLLKRNDPRLHIHCSDYTPKSIQNLKRIFTEADEIVLFDMLNDHWVNAGKNCLYLLFGIDTVFTDKQLKKIFDKMNKSGIEHILFVPCGELTFYKLCAQKAKYLLYKIMNKPISFAGYLRTRESYIAIFEKYYHIESTNKVGESEGFLLALRKAAS